MSKVCPLCSDQGWRPNTSASGEPIWTPLMNDALPCECGALARRYVEQKASVLGQDNARDAQRYRYLRDRSTYIHNNAWFGGCKAVKLNSDFFSLEEAIQALERQIDAYIEEKTK